MYIDTCIIMFTIIHLEETKPYLYIQYFKYCHFYIPGRLGGAHLPYQINTVITCFSILIVVVFLVDESCGVRCTQLRTGTFINLLRILSSHTPSVTVHTAV